MHEEEKVYRVKSRPIVLESLVRKRRTVYALSPGKQTFA